MVGLLQFAISASANGIFLDHSRWVRDLAFSTNRHGFAALEGFIPTRLQESFQLYDQSILPRVQVSWNGIRVWEGRLEDVSIRGEGTKISALGYWRGYSDSIHSGSYISSTASTIVACLISEVSTLNDFMSSGSGLVESPDVNLTENYEDRPHAEILERLELIGDDQTPPRVWEAGVWEDASLHFRPRSSASRGWYVDAEDIGVERTIGTLRNSVYAVYQDKANQRVVTTTSTCADSTTRF